MTIFTHYGFLRGFRLTIPLALSVATYGLVFGMLAQKTGMAASEAMLMSFTVFAGVAQIISTELWHHPLPIAAIIFTTFTINARHLLMGAAVQPWFRNLTPLQTYVGLFFCTDENWAIAMREFQNGERDAAFLVGGGVAVYVGWVTASWLGFQGALFIADPARFGLDFAFVAVFIALLTGMWKGKQDLLPWCVAAFVAVVTEKCLPGKWYIVTGALAGSGIGAWRYGR